MEYQGVIEKVYATKNDWSSIRIRLSNGKLYTAAGKIAFPSVGTKILIEGEIVKHPTYGDQIQAKNSAIQLDTSEAGTIAYLSSGLIKGVGESLAKRIVAKFGKDTYRVIEKEPNKLTEVRGISSKKKDSIVASYNETKLYSSLYASLSGKVTTNQATKIIEKYGKNAVKVIEENPYSLIYDLEGFGFIKADSIAKASGLKYDSPERVGAAIVYVLKTMSEKDGHCYGTIDTIQEAVLDLIVEYPKLGDVKLEKKLKKTLINWTEESSNFVKKNKITTEQLAEIESCVKQREHLIECMADCILNEQDANHIVIDDERLYWKYIFDAETYIAEKVATMCSQRPVKYISDLSVNKAIERIEISEGYCLEDEQKNAAKVSLNNRLSVITGGPGRGKSTIIKTILAAWNDDRKVILCAPTGKAAQRMKEITGIKAETAHRIVNFDPPKDCLIICDEASMLDIKIAQKLIEFSINSNLILVGDIDQLPSIGAGAFFKDMVQSPIIPTVKLIKGHRNSGAIALNAEAINSGIPIRKYKFDDSFIFIPATKDIIQSIIIKEYLRLRDKYGEENVCILVPMRQKSMSASNVLNELIRDIVNPYTSGMSKIDSCQFREGDRIMQIRNITKKEVRYEDGTNSTGVFNGDCGKVINIEPEEDLVQILFDDGRIVDYSSRETEDLVLAYAMTFHKSQGSEYKGVIVVQSMEHYIMLKRNGLYTAETRAKSEVVCIGDEKAFNDAASNLAARTFGDVIRNTYLKQRLLTAVKAV